MQNLPQQATQSEMYFQKDEINLSDIFSALFTKWRWLAGITVAGTLLAVLTALILPKEYEVDARLMLPTRLDVAVLNSTGYINKADKADKADNDSLDNLTQLGLFIQFYDKLRSADNFYQFVKTNAWLNKFYPDTSASEDEQFNSLYKALSFDILEPKKKKGEVGDVPPSLVGLKLLSKDEALAVKFVNGYISYTNQATLNSLADQGLAIRDLEKQGIEGKLTALRKIAEVERVTQLVKLTKAYKIASAMGIKKPTTIEALSRESGKFKSLVYVGDSNKNDLALMGTDYLNNEIVGLRNRIDSILFIEAFPELKQQLLNIKSEEGKKEFKAQLANDAFIDAYPTLEGRLMELNQLTFDFKNAQSFRFDKTAMMDGQAEKPNKALIVSLGFVLSFMLALFFVLNKHALEQKK